MYRVIRIRWRRLAVIGALALAAGLLVWGIIALLRLTGVIPEKWYAAEDIGRDIPVSSRDADSDGIDDYADIVQGARAFVRTEPRYHSAYYEGGYPPAGEGVCTDVVVYAFLNAGYDLKELVAADIAADYERATREDGYERRYTELGGLPDPSIDFRRVRNLQPFFDRYATPLPLELDDVTVWQPGDIAVFPGHIAIVSDRFTKEGLPWMIHHGGSGRYEENALERYEIIGHYRWEG